MKKVIVFLGCLMIGLVQAQPYSEVEIAQMPEKLIHNAEFVADVSALYEQGFTPEQIVDCLLLAEKNNAYVWELYLQEPLILTCLMVNVVAGVCCWWIFERENKEKEKMGITRDLTLPVEH